MTEKKEITPLDAADTFKSWMYGQAIKGYTVFFSIAVNSGLKYEIYSYLKPEDMIGHLEQIIKVLKQEKRYDGAGSK